MTGQWNTVLRGDRCPVGFGDKAATVISTPVRKARLKWSKSPSFTQ